MNKGVFLFLMLGGCKSVNGLAPVEDLNKLIKQIKTDPSDVVAIQRQATKTQQSRINKLEVLNSY